MTTHGLLVCAPLLALLVWAAIVDGRTRRIPNWLTFTMILSGFVVNILALGPTTPGQSMLGFVVGFGLPLILFILGAIGGGDVKLLAGIGAWMGPEVVLKVFAIAAIAGAVIVITQALMQRRGKVLMRNSALLAVNIAHLGDVGVDHVRKTGQASRSVDRPLPYAVPVLIAMAILMARSWR
jgi:prepilin peptidase CpaA